MRHAPSPDHAAPALAPAAAPGAVGEASARPAAAGRVGAALNESDGTDRPRTVRDLLLTADEILALAGGLTQPRRQLEELRARGFWRARMGRDHRVILERAHYLAVCAGAIPPAAPGPASQRTRPQLQPLN